MRAPSRHRPMRRALAPLPDNVDLETVAAKVRYVGSAEHKSYPSFAGDARLRATDATKCDPRFKDPEPLTAWLATAITCGQVGPPWDGGFPKYVWFRDGDLVYEGRLVNRGNGDYKGYALKPDEVPEGL